MMDGVEGGVEDKIGGREGALVQPSPNRMAMD